MGFECLDCWTFSIFLLYFLGVLKFASIAHLVEQRPFKSTVPGSTPGGRTCDLMYDIVPESLVI